MLSITTEKSEDLLYLSVEKNIDRSIPFDYISYIKTKLLVFNAT